MTPGFVVAFGGVLFFGVICSVIVVLATKARPRHGDVDASLQAEIDERLARAERAARCARVEIEEVRALIAR